MGEVGVGEERGRRGERESEGVLETAYSDWSSDKGHHTKSVPDPPHQSSMIQSSKERRQMSRIGHSSKYARNKDDVMIRQVLRVWRAWLV